MMEQVEAQNTKEAVDGDDNGALTCRRYESFGQLGSIADEWDECVRRSDGDIYSTFDWCRTRWKFYGHNRRLEVYLVRRGTDLVAIFPFFRERSWLAGLPLRLIRIVGCDHSVTTCNVVITPYLENEVTAVLVTSLERSGANWDVIHIGPLPGYAKRTEHFVKALKHHCLEARLRYDRNVSVQTVFPLPRTYAEYVKALSRNERHSLRRKERGIRKRHRIEYVLRKAPNEVREAFAKSLALHQRQWAIRGKLGHFGDWPDAHAFHETLIRALAPMGRAFIFELLADRTTIGSQYCFRFGRRLHCFLSARDTANTWSRWSPNTLCFMELVRSAIEGGVQIVDALRGYYQYKLSQGGHLVSQESIMIIRRTLRAQAGLSVLRCAAWLLDKVYYRIWFARLAPTLRLLRGPLWTLWIRSRL